MAPTPNVELLFGPMLIGTFLNMILYGILIVQIYHYYHSYRQDAKWMKCFIFYLFVIETLNTGCDIAMMYQPLIAEFGKAQALRVFPTLFAAQPIICVCVSTPIQLFFAWRVKVLTHNTLLAVIITCFSLVSLGGGVWTTALLIHLKLFALKPRLHWAALVWFLTSVVADVLIASVLVYSLSKRKTGFTGTDDAIQKIIRMTVSTGMVTAFFAIADVIFFMTLPHTALNFIWDIALTKIYANCLMSSLNARSSMNDTSSSSPRYLSSSTLVRRQNDKILEVNSPAHILYELDQQQSSGSRRSDTEYGITVTKVTCID